MRSLGDRTVDLLVVGGGIVGAGIARDAALRGLSVALVEQNDLASGTSSRDASVPTEKRHRSRSPAASASADASSTTRSRDPNNTRAPADRADANARTCS